MFGAVSFEWRPVSGGPPPSLAHSGRWAFVALADGLGIAIVDTTGSGPKVLETEAGHVGMAAFDPCGDALIAELRQRNRFASWENALKLALSGECAVLPETRCAAMPRRNDGRSGLRFWSVGVESFCLTRRYVWSAPRPSGPRSSHRQILNAPMTACSRRRPCGASPPATPRFAVARKCSLMTERRRLTQALRVGTLRFASRRGYRTCEREAWR